MRPSLALERHRDTIHQIVARHNARNPRVFGSAARGSDQEGSDLDILVDPVPGMTLFDLGRMIGELETLLGVAVDVVTPAAMGAALLDSVEMDLRPL